jgi:hypothetical protein
MFQSAAQQMQGQTVDGVRRALRLATIVLALGSHAGPVVAQDQHQHQEPASRGWQWLFDGNVFFGRNDQRRLYADDSSWESQNWFMVAADRQSARGRLTANLMFTLEPFTVPDRGSPQLFQTGESYQGVPLVNFQHQHDLLMGLGLTYTMTRPRVAYTFGADLVGSPTLGPTAFMHRSSARDNPQAPLIHHYVDSTHITPGVLRAGVRFGSLNFEGSVFRGAAPDEDRVDIERPGLDSWATRIRWQRGPWEAQVSGGHLKQPEWFEPFDATRITASLTFDGEARGRPLAMTLAWGANRQFNGFNGNVDGFLLEGDLRATGAVAVYGRIEVTAKELFGLSPHPKEFAHRHWFSEIKAFTFGSVWDLPLERVGRLGVGADVTLYDMGEDLRTYYDPSRSFHIFLRWRPRTAVPHIH